MREADAQQEIEREGEEEEERQAASRSFPPHEFARRGMADSSCLSLCYVTAEPSGGSRTTPMLKAGEDSGAPVERKPAAASRYWTF